MTKHIKIIDIVRETGLSRATVDRALNKRGGVHPRTEKVINDTIAHLKSRHDERLRIATPFFRRGSPTVDAVFRTGRGMMELFKEARARLAADVTIYDMWQRENDEVLERVASLCAHPERPLIIDAKKSERLHAALIRAREHGKRIIAIVSDLDADARDAFVGIDDRRAGQTAAFVIGNLFKRKPGTVGVVLGDSAYSCHEDREIGFRSFLRAEFPGVRLTDAAKGDDSTEKTAEAVRALLDRHPEIEAIYNVAGGNTGLARALTEAGRAGAVFVVTHEVTAVTVGLVQDGIVHFLISQNTEEMFRRAVELARSRPEELRKEVHYLAFDLFTPLNVPSHRASRAAVAALP